MLPRAIAAAVAGRRAVPVTIGMSGARVLRFDAAGEPALYLKSLTAPVGAPIAGAIVAGGIVAGGIGDTLGDEAARLRWMAAHGLPVPAVLHHETADDAEHLLLAEVGGVDAATAAEAPGRDAAAIVAALADGLRLLHDTPVADCPFRYPSVDAVIEARARAAAGLVRRDELEPEHADRSLDDLLAELAATRPDTDGVAFTHGDYCLPNVVLRGPAGGPLGIAGFIDCARAGVGDPYRDLALAVRSVQENLGDAWVPALLDRYGVRALDERRLRFYLLLDEFH